MFSNNWDAYLEHLSIHRCQGEFSSNQRVRVHIEPQSPELSFQTWWPGHMTRKSHWCVSQPIAKGLLHVTVWAWVVDNMQKRFHLDLITWQWVITESLIKGWSWAKPGAKMHPELPPLARGDKGAGRSPDTHQELWPAHGSAHREMGEWIPLFSFLLPHPREG